MDALGSFELVLPLILIVLAAESTENSLVYLPPDGSCNFDNSSFCGWQNDVTTKAQFTWSIRKGSTPSIRTGPPSDVSGNGKYVYAEASSRQHGDKARLLSPRIRGQTCMSFMYHMYGGTMGSMIIYAKTNSSEMVEWVKTGNQPNEWLKAGVLFNYTEEYQVVVEAVRGTSWSSDVAIDEIQFHPGNCQRLVHLRLHAFVKTNAAAFKLDRKPAHSGWTYQFTLHVVQTKNSSADVMYFVYPGDIGCVANSISRVFLVHEIRCFPTDFFYATENYQAGLRKVLLIDRGPQMSLEIALGNYQPCCNQPILHTFYANASFKELSTCPPGWHMVDEHCFQVHLTPGRTWREARIECLNYGGKLAVLGEGVNFDLLSRLLDEFLEESSRFYVGAFAANDGRWISVKMEPFPSESALWGPYEPSGDGWCGNLIYGEKWNAKWKGKGWRVNDNPCLAEMGFICQKEKVASSLSCDNGWFEVDGSCFQINAENMKTWDQARLYCFQQNSHLAIVDTETIRKSIGERLTALDNDIPDADIKTFIGIKKLPMWQWLNGGNISSNIWKAGLPDYLQSGECGALVMDSLSWKLFQRSCSLIGYQFICETAERNDAYGRSATYFGKAEAGESLHAVDGNFASCFTVAPINEQKPWWSIALKNNKKSFVYKIRVKNRPDCCIDEMPQLGVRLADGETVTTPPCKVYNWNVLQERLMVCDPVAMATNVTIYAITKGNFTLCEVMISATDDILMSHGVKQELWFKIPSGTVASLLADSRFPDRPDIVNNIDNFDSPFDMHTDYGQRLTAYIQVPQSGNYTFYVACDDVCELWLDTSDPESLENEKDNEQGKILLAKLEGAQWTDHNQWDKFPTLQTSKEIWLSQCRFYYFEVLMKQSGVKDCMSVGMKLPNGTFERPITGRHLYWVRPGVSYVDFIIRSFPRVVKIETGHPLVIQGTYKYCCRGIYCPGCPVKLKLQFAGQTFVVHDGLAMDCQENHFNQTVETLFQEGIYKINIAYGPPELVVKKEIGEVHISAIQVKGCNFTIGFCSWINKNSGWKLTKEGESLLQRGQFAYVRDGTASAVLQSPWIQFNVIHQKTGLCLTFLYSLSTHSGSSLEVFVTTSSNLSIWRVHGYQGETWSHGQVSFTAKQDFKVIFVVTGKLSDSYPVAVDSVFISTKHCDRFPIHSLPGYQCSSEGYFQCDNGQCVSKDMVCDADPACIDGSDERNCRCLTSQFMCPTGECLSVNQLCDNSEDCSDGIDEAKCERGCPEGSFTCSGGDCVSWSSTCSGEKVCEDESDEPSVCGATGCPMNDLSCTSSNYTSTSAHSCQGNRVNCNFEDGLCGLKHESQFHWSIGSGETPTKETGPSYDHTTFLHTGKYVFLEASGRRESDFATLTSDWIKAGQDTCVQFWYYMKGRHIGSLNVYIQTNVSSRQVWSRRGDKGDKWLFGQVGDKDELHDYKVVFAGVVGNGIHGDIAIDDLNLLNVKCGRTYGDKTPECLFDLDMCSWTASKAWRISKLQPLTYLRNDWQHSLGGFAYFRDCTFETIQSDRQTCLGSLKSPVIHITDGYRCMRFWYYLEDRQYSSVEVFIKSLNDRNATEFQPVWMSTSDPTKTGIWSYTQLPLQFNSITYEILIEVKKTSRRTVIAIDDVTFQLEPCQRIPWEEKEKDYSKNPLNAVYFWKLDGSDKNISLQGSAQYITNEAVTALYLDGQDAYAEIPAVPIERSSFTIACRIKILVRDDLMHILSDWSPPHQFRMYLYSNALSVELRRLGSVEILVHFSSDSDILANTWTHVAFTWDRETRKGVLYLDGIPAGSAVSSYAGADIDLNPTNHTTYEIGFKRDTGEKLKALLRDLVIFLRPLSYGEVYTLFSPSRALCPVRPTMDGNCCFIPFTYKNKRYDTCTNVEEEFLWCSASPNLKSDLIWGWCSQNDACLSFKGDFCGWTNTIKTAPPWKILDKQAMQRFTVVVDDHAITKGPAPSSGAKENDFQVDFERDHNSYIKFTDLPDLWAFTICLWMKTTDNTTAGTPMWYRVRYEDRGRYITAIALVDYVGFYVYVGEVSSERTSASANDGKWHHVCLMWTSEGGKISLHFDKETLLGDGFAAGEKIPGGGEFIIGLTANQTAIDSVAGQFIGTISYVQIFNKALGGAVIHWMMHSCGGALSNAIVPWSKIIQGFVGNITVQRPAQCTDIEGSRLLVFTNGTVNSLEPTSIIESPLYERSYEGYSVCVYFRYIIYGTEKRELRLYQQINSTDHSRRLVWAVNETNNTGGFWKYGRVALPSVANHKISFEAVLGSQPGYIGIRGLQVTPGYCLPVPLGSTQECGQNISSLSGYIFSPFYPGYYTPLTRCHWRIAVPTGYIIQLHFVHFHLEDHPLCQNDYLLAYDGVTRTLMGKYCGDRHPEFLESSSNAIELSFVSNDKITRSGFKLHFTSRKVSFGEKNCTRYEGCPSSCECSPISPYGSEIVITAKKGIQLTAVPRKLPSQTVVILFPDNKISHLPAETFTYLAKLQFLDLSGNRIFRIARNVFGNLTSLESLRLSSNFIRELPEGSFEFMDNLQTLDLSTNLIEEIPTITSLTSLRSLSLRQNRIKTLSKGTFNGTRKLKYLYLQQNQLEELPENAFADLLKLKVLYLNDNKLRTLSSRTFHGLSSLEKLHLHNNSYLLKDFSFDAFDGLVNLKELNLDEFILCCYAEKAIPGLNCISPKNEFSSCADLMKNKAIQICVWILGLSALIGNAFVIIMRVMSREENKVHSFLLTNLAVADLLMGVYLLIVAIKDRTWQGEYFKHDIEWRSGKICELSGSLSMLSSEVSVLMLTLITTDRLICIVFPFRLKRIGRKSAYLIVTGIWAFGVIVSIIPMMGINYFYDGKRQIGFYGKSAVCLPLQLSPEKQAGWEYAVAIFIALNFASFMYILCAYVAMFCTVRKMTRQVRSTNMNRESQMAKRLVFIILTDLFCWMPVIIIGLLSILDKFHDPEKHAYVWIAVFVLPVNSSINPILYTFSTPFVKRKVREKRRKWSSFLEKTVGMQTSPKVTQGSLLALPRRNTVSPWESQTSPSTSTSPCTSSRPLDDIPECMIPENKLRLLEIPNIFPDETSYAVGFVVAWCEHGTDVTMRLIKHFSKSKEEAWKKEVEVVSQLNEGRGHPNILKYCWSSTADQCSFDRRKKRIQRLKKTSFLLCYEHVSSTTLQSFLKNRTMTQDVLFVVAIDLIYALQYLEQKGIVHNNITTSNVLIGSGLRIPPITAVLGGFGGAQRIPHDFPPEYTKTGHSIKDLMGKNILQFGFVLSELIKNCQDSEEFSELHDVMHLCLEQGPDVRLTALQVRDLMEELWYRTDIWDTSL